MHRKGGPSWSAHWRDPKGLRWLSERKALYCCWAPGRGCWATSIAREELCQQSLALFREGGDVAGVGEALLSLGSTSWQKGELATARVRLEESLKVGTEAGDKNIMAWSLD